MYLDSDVLRYISEWEDHGIVEKLNFSITRFKKQIVFFIINIIFKQQMNINKDMYVKN